MSRIKVRTFSRRKKDDQLGWLEFGHVNTAIVYINKIGYGLMEAFKQDIGFSIRKESDGRLEITSWHDENSVFLW